VYPGCLLEEGLVQVCIVRAPMVTHAVVCASIALVLQAVVERAMRERRERLSHLRSWFWSRTSLNQVGAA
jgi:hypothetical protein